MAQGGQRSVIPINCGKAGLLFRNLTPLPPKRFKQGEVTHNPNLREAKAGGSGIKSQSELHIETLSQSKDKNHKQLWHVQEGMLTRLWGGGIMTSRPAWTT